jgi:hypothetical protein
MYIAIDPSGSFNEGKGHTGISKIIDWDWNTLETKSYSAKNYTDRHTYWKDIIYSATRTCENVTVIIESFVVRSNGFLVGKMPETSLLIGALVYELERLGIPYVFQSPSQAKTRFKDEYLGKYIPGYERRDNGYYYLNGIRINDHIRDSLKHLLYFEKYGGTLNE